jgi:hypothetical protein
MTIITDDERAAILSNDLAHDEVVGTLAGFLHRHLQDVHGVDIPSPRLAAVITEYRDGVGEWLDEALAVAEAFKRSGRPVP